MANSPTVQKNPIGEIRKYIISAAAANNRKHNHPRKWQTHKLFKRIQSGNYKIYTLAAAANNRKHNDPRKWQNTHFLLKRIHPGNYEIYASAPAANHRKHRDPRE